MLFLRIICSMLIDSCILEIPNTATHVSVEEFVELLISLKTRHPSVYEQWAPAFPVAYVGTVEEVAKRGIEE